MKCPILVVLVYLMSLLMTGCSTPNPYSMRVDLIQGQYDSGGQNEGRVEKPEKVAVHVYKQNRVSNANRNTYRNVVQTYGEDVENELYAKLTEAIGSLAFFELVPRGDIDPLVIEDIVSGRSGSSNVLPSADYVISAKVVTMNMEEQRGGNVSTMNTILANKFNLATSTVVDERCFTVSLSVYFTFIQCDSKRTIKTKTISRTGQGLLEGVIQAWLMEAARGCAQEFAQTLGGKYAPEERVIETRGGHEVALIALGTNYGLAEGTEVNFFTYVDNPYMPQKRYKRVVGVGRVFSVEEDSAWVEVFDYSEAHVEAGMHVAVQHVQNHTFRWRYFLRRLGGLLRY